MAVEFSTEIRLGDLLTIAAFVGVGFSTYYKMKGRIDIQDVTFALKFGYIERDIKKIEEIENTNDEIKEEQNNINGQITYLKYRMGEKPDGEYDGKGHKRVGP